MSETLEKAAQDAKELSDLVGWLNQIGGEYDQRFEAKPEGTGIRVKMINEEEGRSVEAVVTVAGVFNGQTMFKCHNEHTEACFVSSARAIFGLMYC